MNGAPHGLLSWHIYCTVFPSGDGSSLTTVEAFAYMSTRPEWEHLKARAIRTGLCLGKAGGAAEKKLVVKNRRTLLTRSRLTRRLQDEFASFTPHGRCLRLTGIFAAKIDTLHQVAHTHDTRHPPALIIHGKCHALTTHYEEEIEALRSDSESSQVPSVVVSKLPYALPPLTPPSFEIWTGLVKPT